MNEQLKKLQAKYENPGPSGVIEPGCAAAQPVIEFSGELETWRDSRTIVRLRDFLKDHGDLGFRLVEWDGCPTMHFEPGLHPSEKDRWDIARTAERLLIDAADDLKYLLSRGLLSLKPHGSF